MNKVWLIIQREYLTRVRNRTFILSTFLFPILIIGFIAAVTFFAVKSVEQQRIAVIDRSGIFVSKFKDNASLKFDYPADVTRDNYRKKGYNALLVIPERPNVFADTIRLISDKQLGIAADGQVRNQLTKIYETKLLLDKGIDQSVLDSIRTQSEDRAFEFKSYEVKGGQMKEANSNLAYIIGFGAGIILYTTLFIYGAAVMRGVMEEKVNRIAEVMVSSVKPFQMMLGKIMGIAAVGLTQFVLWIVLILSLTAIMGLFLPADMMQQAQAANQSVPGGMGQAATGSKAYDFIRALGTSPNWGLILFCFLFYFIGGYLFYAALFAAVGSVVNEDPQEAQALMLPITLPIILSFVIMVNTVSNPNSSIAVWASIIPFSSPMVMMARIPFGVPGTVPYVQLIASMVSLVLGFLLTTWLSGKIYRTGILLYGKKVTLKELARWAVRK